MKIPAKNSGDLQSQLKLALQISERYKTGRDRAERLLEQKSSELYRSNEALLRGQENLQQEIAQATCELQTSNTRLKRALEEKSTFMGSLSHELRTPLNAVIGLSELLLKTQMDDIQRDYVSTIFESSSSLTKLINGVLDIAQIEAGKLRLNPEATSCSNVASILKKMFALEATNKNNKIIANIHSNVPNYLLLDEGRYAQVLTNLISNALKNTKGGEVVVSFRINEDSEGISLQTTVSDTGIGISKKQIEKIFQAYEQFGHFNQGVGLGLAICRYLIDLMQGELTCESELGTGSQFSFSIPTSQCSEQDLPEALPVTLQNFGDIKVLIAEDNPVNQKVLLAQFMQFGIEPTIVENGQLAVDKLMEFDFDVVFLDLNMPVMDGETALHMIREQVTLGDEQYCVALTATSFYNKREQMLEIGFNDFLSKPLTLTELGKMLTSISRDKDIQDDGDNLLPSKEHYGFDISFLESQFGEAAGEILRQLAPVFLEHSYSDLDELRSAVSENKTSRIKKLSHSLRGAVSSMGQLELAAQLEVMESEAGEIDLNANLQKIEFLMGELKASLEQNLANS